jgi:protein associated with RNAse G/E
LYAELSVEVWAKVKSEKIDRAEFRAKLKVMKYSEEKDRIESMALDEGEGKEVAGGHQ